MNEFVPVPIERFLAQSREEEIRARSRGLYDAAVKCQRHADIIEETGDYPLSLPCFMDRGVSNPLDCYVMDGVLMVPSSDGAVALAFTEDRAWVLWCTLVEYLGMTPEDLRAAASALALSEHT